jgi:ferredoxin-NADP reductase
MADRTEQDLTLLVRQMRWESEGVMSVLLEDVGGAPLPAWQPGAHLDLHLPGALVRQYSLCGDPADRFGYRIAVLREPQGGEGRRPYTRSCIRAW